MPKRRRTVSADLPTYRSDRRAWRRAIIANVLEAQQANGATFHAADRVEVVVLLYLPQGRRHTKLDLDNRLKDILDALQGRFGGRGVRRSRRRLIENDRQVHRIVMEKQVARARRQHVGGRILVRPYRAQRWPLQVRKRHKFLKRAR